MTYEKLIAEADNAGLMVVEKKFKSNAMGLCKGRKIGIESTFATCTKKCVLAEELGHFYTTVGDIVEQKNDMQIKQENLARSWAIDKLLPFEYFISAVKAGCYTTHEIAEYFDIDERFLCYSIEHYKRKLGIEFPLTSLE